MFVCSFAEVSIKPASSFSATLHPSSEDTSLDLSRSILFPTMNIGISLPIQSLRLSFHSSMWSNELLFVTS